MRCMVFEGVGDFGFYNRVPILDFGFCGALAHFPESVHAFPRDGGLLGTLLDFGEGLCCGRELHTKVACLCGFGDGGSVGESGGASV